VTSQAVAQASRTNLSGTTIGQYREGDKLLDIVVCQPADERDSISDLADAYGPTASGRSVPLSQLARVGLAWEPGVLWRHGRDYAVTARGDVAEGAQGQTVSAQLWPALQQLAATMRPGYGIEMAGAVEESSKGQGSIAAGAPVMLFIIFTLLMLQLRSFSRAMPVFLTGPLGIAGVAAALLLMDSPFGFVALLGVTALMGMIARNSVILIDEIEQDRRRGLPAREAIVESAVRRIRSIALKAAAAVMAMIPLARSVFWGPMAVAIMGGLVMATALTLLALPAVYSAWFRVRREAAEAS
jgi:multidrug efflux pump